MKNKTITIYPYQPFEIYDGINFLNFQSVDEFSKLIFQLNSLKNGETFLDDVDQYVHFYTDSSDELKSSIKKVALIGDLTEYNINSLNNTKNILKKIISDSIIYKEKSDQINQNLNELIMDMTSSYDEIFDFESSPALEKIVKSKNLKIDTGNWRNYYDKLQSVIEFYRDFSNKTMLIFHGLERLLNINQLNELNEYLKANEITVVSMESYRMVTKSNKVNFKVYSIDEDHVRFDT
ncbi:type II-A CRISPR-associated protein Csn2 [Companilactobacillus baiquanensis]|uniref:Type II-A CRISPR-associated protein Csn2 n=1 Tax=Companilactobacillus baiquanensis TaxID=2486005 RepID=A0ABW1V0D0_9LACO|nr:type II-A CRISPR-associated protein Csn2 [Companilactobacillus baiquanensis]